jgi:hypothetical protein
VKFPITEETKKKIEALKGLLAHSHSGISLSELCDWLCDLGIQNWDLGKKVVRVSKRKTTIEKDQNQNHDQNRSRKSHCAQPGTFWPHAKERNNRNSVGSEVVQAS